MLLLRLVERNLKLYYRDRSAVFFSFLAILMIIVMYAVFLGQNQIDNLKATMGDIPGIEGLIISWLMAGILCVSTVTVPLSSLMVLVEDRQNRFLADFYTAPVNRRFLVLSYFISSTIITSIVSVVNLIGGQVYLVVIGAPLLSFGRIVLLLGLIIFSSLIFSIIFFLIAMSIRSAKAFGSVTTIVGTLVGFFGGIYLPIGVMSSSVQSVVNSLPIAQSVTLFRRVYMAPYLEEVFTGAPANIVAGYRKFNGLEIYFGSFQLQTWHMVVIFIVFGIFFYWLSVRKIKKAYL